MILIEAYVYEVTRRLPEKNRDDIAMELQSTIEEMLPENYSDDDVKHALSKLGNPAELAASYRDTPQYLIGPKVYAAYIWTLKRTIPWAIFITILIYTVDGILSFAGEESILSAVGKAFGLMIAGIITVLIQVFFWITIVFVAMERIGLAKTDRPLVKSGEAWTPDDLKSIQVISKKKAISKGDVLFSLAWTAIWAIVYFNADHLAGVYQSTDGKGLQFVMPVFNQGVLLSYWPIIAAIILLEVGLAVYKWKAAKWTMKLAAINTVIRVLSVIAFIVIISNPHLTNEAIIPYMAEVTETTPATVTSFLEFLYWLIVAGVVIPTLIEIYDSYRKAKI
ncbi:MAG TPA: hypothetical protein VIG80_02955 [Bacillaceae bacterium]